MIEHRGISQILHLIIGVSILIIPISLYIGLRPICILASLGLGLFLLDYSLLPFQHLYQTFTQWLPFLFELNLLNGVFILTQFLHFSKFWSITFLGICLLRNVILIYAKLLPSDHHCRVYIEHKLLILSTFLIQESRNAYQRLVKCFNHQDDREFEKLQLEQIHSDEHTQLEHDETIQRFQQIAQEFASPIIANVDCSTNSTPPVRRHHQRILQQSDLEPLPRTPITPAHTNSSKGKILHSTMNGSYTGPVTRNRTKVGPSSITNSPTKGKASTEFTFLISKREEDSHIQRS